MLAPESDEAAVDDSAAADEDAADADEAAADADEAEAADAEEDEADVALPLPEDAALLEDELEQPTMPIASTAAKAMASNFLFMMIPFLSIGMPAD